jgi:hypothetical protein
MAEHPVAAMAMSRTSTSAVRSRVGKTGVAPQNTAGDAREELFAGGRIAEKRF